MAACAILRRQSMWSCRNCVDFKPIGLDSSTQWQIHHVRRRILGGWPPIGPKTTACLLPTYGGDTYVRTIATLIKWEIEPAPQLELACRVWAVTDASLPAPAPRTHHVASERPLKTPRNYSVWHSRITKCRSPSTPSSARNAGDKSQSNDGSPVLCKPSQAIGRQVSNM